MYEKNTKIITVVSAPEWRSILCTGKDSARNWRETAISYPRYMVHSKKPLQSFQSPIFHSLFYYCRVCLNTTMFITWQKTSQLQTSSCSLLGWVCCCTESHSLIQDIFQKQSRWDITVYPLPPHHPPSPPPTLAAQHELWWDSRWIKETFPRLSHLANRSFANLRRPGLNPSRFTNF